MAKQGIYPEFDREAHRKLPDDDLLKAIATQGGNRVLANLGQVCGKEAEYQSRIDFLVQTALKRM